MFSQTTTSYSNYDKGNPKQSLIKKKARTTILNVLNKRQTQEKNLVQAERRSTGSQSPQLQPVATHRTEQETPKSYQQTFHPTFRGSPSAQTRTYDQPTKDNDRYSTRGRPDRQNSVSSLVRKWSADNLSPRSKTNTFSGTDSTESIPKSVIVQKSCLSSNFPPMKKADDGDENHYSVVIQTSANYPPPMRRRSSADVTPHDVTVNAIRVYEATTKMVKDDPEIIASLDRYPSREPPTMSSPTSMQQFTWERDVNTGVDQKTRAVVLKGKPLVPVSQKTKNTADWGMRPRLVSDSVQVSIPFGLPDIPSTPNRTSGSDGWSSSVSVCVPFQITDNQVKPLPVRGGTGPQSLPASDGLQIEDINELFDRSVEPGSVSFIESTSSLMEPDYPTSKASQNVLSSSPTLVTVRRKPEDEVVQKIIHFQDSTLCNDPPDDVFDKQDGLTLSKRGNYSLVDNYYNTTAYTGAKKSSPSSVSNRHHPEATAGSPKIRPRAILVDSKTPHSVTKAKTASLPSSNQNEVEMLRARVKQLEAELELEKAKHAPNDAILSSIPILEKEKLRLQSQVNEALQDLAKAKSQLRMATYTTNRLEAEKDVLETKYRKLERDFEKLQDENVSLQFQHNQLLREKKNRTNEEDMDLDANLVTIQSLSKRNEELTQSECELKERVCLLGKGLQDVKEAVAKVKEENSLLHEEIVGNGVAMAGSMNECLMGLQQVVDQMNSGLHKNVEDDEIQRLTEELTDNKSCMHALLQRVVELETNSGHHSQSNYDGCPNCEKLEEDLKDLHMDYNELKVKLEKLEENFEEVSNDREDLFQETKYLKKVLSYRQDIMEVQVSEKTNRQLQRLETNLEEAEKKCKDLEDEVGLLYKQKQTLLVNIMKLHDEEVAEQNADGDDDDDEEFSDDDIYSSDEMTTTPSPSRSKSGSLKKSLYVNNDAEFSSGASFYGSDTDSDSESDEWSELEGSSRRLQDLVSGLKSDRKRLRSNLKELMHDKRSLNKRVDKSNQDFKSLMKRMEKLDSENTSLREKVKTDRRTLKAKLKTEEKENVKLRDSLKEMESEKAALMKCIEMNSAAANDAESSEPTEELEDDDLTRLIAKAQAFAQGEKQTKLEDAIEEESEDEIESVDEKDNDEEESAGNEEAESEERSSSSSEEETEEEKEHKPCINRAPIPPPLIQNITKSDSEDNKEDKGQEDRQRYEMEDVMSPPPPPPHARLLQRRASTVGINMDRVNREKQHLEEEVASLKKYLNRSAYRRRYSTVETPKAPPLGAMKTLESLLQKSDMELKEANAKICRLQSLNADLEERLKDAEINQDDLRRAVVIANNYAAEEREKNTALEEERDGLMQKLETLKRENNRLRKSRAINAVYRKGGRGVKNLTSSDGDMVDSDGPDIESDLSSLSRRSSNASDL